MAQTVTIANVSYADVPALQIPKSGGGMAVFADPSPTTAVDADVASGKTYLKADGTWGTGSASGGGGGGMQTSVVVPEQTVTATGEYTLLTGNTQSLVSGEPYIVTVNGARFVTTAMDIYGSPSVLAEYYVRVENGSGNEVYLSVYQSSLYGTYTVKVEHIDSWEGGGGGSATLITKNITANGTYNAEDDDADGYSSVTVNVSGGGGTSKNVQIAAGVNRINTTEYTAVTDQSITVAKSGTYHVYWNGFRSSTSGTNGSCLYVNGAQHSSGNQTSFSNHGQAVHLTGVSLTQGDVITVRARARGTNYYMYVGNLTIIEA